MISFAPTSNYDKSTLTSPSGKIRFRTWIQQEWSTIPDDSNIVVIYRSGELPKPEKKDPSKGNEAEAPKKKKRKEVVIYRPDEEVPKLKDDEPEKVYEYIRPAIVTNWDGE